MHCLYHEKNTLLNPAVILSLSHSLSLSLSHESYYESSTILTLSLSLLIEYSPEEVKRMA